MILASCHPEAKSEMKSKLGVSFTPFAYMFKGSKHLSESDAKSRRNGEEISAAGKIIWKHLWQHFETVMSIRGNSLVHLHLCMCACIYIFARACVCVCMYTHKAHTHMHIYMVIGLFAEGRFADGLTTERPFRRRTKCRIAISPNGAQKGSQRPFPVHIKMKL